MCGFIKIDKKILEWEWYKDEHTKNFFFHCLLKANSKDERFKGIVIERGQFIASLSVLSDELFLTVNELRTAINHLKTTGEITVKTYPKFSVFTVVNYDLYQCESQVESQANHRQTTGKPQANHRLLVATEKEKEDKKMSSMSMPNKAESNGSKSQKKEPVAYYPNDKLLDSAFKEFLVMRNKIKKPLATKQAMTRIRNKIEKLSGGDNNLAILILNQSTDHCWQDVYPLKEEIQKQTNNVFDEWRNA